jgi:F-type H+-transporting ATPase subunit alpha
MNAGISVSRVGGAAQTKSMKKVAGGLRLDLASFRELEAFAQLGTDLDAATQQRLDRGYRMVELLKQGQFAPMDMVDQVMSIYAGTRGHLDEVKRDEVADWEKDFLTFVRDQVPELRKRIDESKELDSESERQLEAAIAEFKRQRAAKAGGAKQLAGAR